MPSPTYLMSHIKENTREDMYSEACFKIIKSYQNMFILSLSSLIQFYKEDSSQ